MISSQVLRILPEAGLSAEEFGKIIGISGMSVRRWGQKDPSFPIAKVYQAAIREAIYELIIQKKLDPQSDCVRELLREGESLQWEAALQHLGIAKNFLGSSTTTEGVLSGLSQIGAQGFKQKEVSKNQKKIFSFLRMGTEWSLWISYLWKVTKSKKIESFDKVIAFGALFYLLSPIDFIPDHIPFFGLLDDFSVLGAAFAYYTKKFGNSL